MREMLAGDVPFAVSPAVALEYEDVLKRPGVLGDEPWLSEDEIDTVLDAVFSQLISFLHGFVSDRSWPIRRMTSTLNAL
ncbi:MULTISPECIES: hypothetical protein [Rhizobium]|uniref:hypothetical protein n=1 Tax=Rhizobium TaxID=379 RepID=UPI0024B1C65D|nr:hypothetical protein [Rhizobium sp. CC1099]WFU86170.1 hypothetical protein QA644_13565 [Rhizobium sp. CC1099]